MRLLFTLLIALVFAGSAVADQVPETPVLTGPNFQQVPASDILVLPTGGTVTTLGDALANSTGNLSNGLVTPTGATTAQTLATLTAQGGVLLDAFRVASDTTDTPAMVRAVAAGVPILLGAKTYTINNYNMAGTPANFVLRGIPGKSIIQRTGASGSQFFSITATNVYIDGVIFDSNKASVSANQWGVFLGQSGQNIVIRNSVFKNNSGTLGYCLVLANQTGAQAGGSFSLLNNEVTGCTNNAIYLASVANGIVDGLYVHDNSSTGLYASSYLAATSTNYLTDVLITNVRAYRNVGAGVSVGGYSAPYSFALPPAQKVTVSNSQFVDNATGSYQVSLSGDYIIADGNQISQSDPGVTVFGGMLCHCRWGQFSNNIINLASASYGIDIGGALYTVIKHNDITLTTGNGIDAGGTLNALLDANVLHLSGTAAGSNNSNIEADGFGSAFPQALSGLVIQNNIFELSGTGTTGVLVKDNGGGTSGATTGQIINNSFVGTNSAGPIQDISYFTGPTAIRIQGNMHNGATMAFPSFNGSNDLIYENVYDEVTGPSATNVIHSIIPRYISQYGAADSVLYVNVTAGGSGYTAATVLSPSVGGCTWTGVAQINSGVIIGVKNTAQGTGCTGTSIVATDSGGGTGATFSPGVTAVVPAYKVLKFQSNATPGNIAQAGVGNVPFANISNSLFFPRNVGVILEALLSGKFWSVTTAIQQVPSTTATLPTCNAAASGAWTAVNDALGPTYGGTVTGGGAVTAPVVCDGTNWKTH